MLNMNKPGFSVTGTTGLVLIVLLLSACAGKVSNNPDTRAIAAKGYRFSAVEINMDKMAGRGMPSANVFRLAQFKSNLQRQFRSNGLIRQNSPYKAVIRLKRIFIRDGASAAVFGFLAGEDRIIGDVHVIDRNGVQKEKFSVKAGNSLGGVTAVISSARADWMYHKFAQLTVQVFTGKKTH